MTSSQPAMRKIMAKISEGCNFCMNSERKRKVDHGFCRDNRQCTKKSEVKTKKHHGNESPMCFFYYFIALNSSVCAAKNKQRIVLSLISPLCGNDTTSKMSVQFLCRSTPKNFLLECSI